MDKFPPWHLDAVRFKRGLSQETPRCRSCVGGGIHYICYTCYHFQPWLDGPHEEVLADLYGEKERARAAGCAGVVVNANDQLILAVEHCILLCRQAKIPALAALQLEGAEHG